MGLSFLRLAALARKKVRKLLILKFESLKTNIIERFTLN